jgi:hypothetical protein
MMGNHSLHMKGTLKGMRANTRCRRRGRDRVCIMRVVMMGRWMGWMRWMGSRWWMESVRCGDGGGGDEIEYV